MHTLMVDGAHEMDKHLLSFETVPPAISASSSILSQATTSPPHWGVSRLTRPFGSYIHQ
jgi:hypothetical protein